MRFGTYTIDKPYYRYELNTNHPMSRFMRAGWVFNTSGILEDITGNGFRATRKNGPKLTGEHTKFSRGAAVDFDGTDDYYDVGTGNPVTGDKLTIIMGCVYDDNSATDYRVFSKSTGGAEADHRVMLGSIASGKTYPTTRTRLKIGGTTTTVILDNGTTNAAAHEIATDGTLTQQGVVYDGSNIRVQQITEEWGYTDSNPTARTGDLTEDSTGIAIGRNGAASGNYFNGRIHYMYIFNFAFDSALSRKMFFNSVYHAPYQFLRRPQSRPVGVASATTTMLPLIMQYH